MPEGRWSLLTFVHLRAPGVRGLRANRGKVGATIAKKDILKVKSSEL